jgi:flagellar biosynthesis/type III secretory pathway chaperone
MTYELIQNLCSVLDRMEALYARILPLLDRERLSLVELNYERLYQELAEKDEILAALRRLDRERLRFQDHFASLTGRPASEISLRWMGEHFISMGGQDSEVGARLLSRRERIEALVGQLTERIQRNARFIERSVKNIRSMAQDISDALGHTQNASGDERSSASHQTYSSKAKVKKAPQKSGALVSKHL